MCLVHHRSAFRWEHLRGVGGVSHPDLRAVLFKNLTLVEMDLQTLMENHWITHANIGEISWCLSCNSH